MHNADLYHQNNGLQLKTATTLINKYGSKIQWKRNNTIIDVGCGDGHVITEMKKYFPSDYTLVGCDINENMVKLANKYYSDEQTSFIVLDILAELSEELKDKFTHVLSFFAINWVMDQQRSFTNIYNLLEPNGECFLLIVGYSPILDVYRNLAKTEKWSPWVYDVEQYVSPYHDTTEPEKEIMKLMTNIGFENIDVHYEAVHYIYNNNKTVQGSLIAISPFMIPNEKMTEFWSDYVQELIRVKGIETKNKKVIDIKFNMKVIVAHGRKPADGKKINTQL